MPDPEYRLLADIGGTNARFALQRTGEEPEHVIVLPTGDYDDLGAATTAYLDRLPDGLAVRRAAVCLACPILGDRVKLTNNRWDFSIADTRTALGLDVLHVINDFAAVALSVPHLAADALEQVGGGPAVPRAPVGVLGAGTGLGVGALMPLGEASWLPVPGEGGHATMAPMTAREDAIFARVRHRFGHASAERVLSGAGIVNLHAAITAEDDFAAEHLTPEEITARAVAGDVLCDETLEMFCLALGTVAANVALTFNAQGGIYIGGGIVRELGERFMRSGFRERFETKGRFSDFLATVPVFQIVKPFSAMIGLAALLDQD